MNSRANPNIVRWTVGKFFAEESNDLEEEFRVIKVPCLPNISNQPASITFKYKWEVVNGLAIKPCEVVGCRNHIDLLK